MKTLPFTKVEAIGNNFVLVDALALPEMDWPLLARRMCSHHTGVGSDGLLVLVLPKMGGCGMRMFNPDGSEDICGNGLRCAATYVYLIGLMRSQEMLFEMIDGLHQTEIVEAGERSAVVKANMRKPSFRAEDIPTTLCSGDAINCPIEVNGATYELTCVLVGTPHAVIFAPVESFWERIPEVSAVIETHPVFPERISVDWCAVESPDSLKIRTWERAVGPTLGCGTGASASLAAANMHGLADPRASVTSQGGTLEVEWPDRGDIFTSGPANIVFEGEWPLAGDEVLSHHG